MNIRSCFLFLLGVLLSTQTLAQAYPNRPVRVLIGYPPGGSNDLVIRSLSARLQESLKQAFVIDNRSGAAGTIAADIAAKAAPDGYTLYSLSSAQVLAPHIRKVVNYDPVKDFRPIALVASAGYVLTVHPSISPNPVNTVADVVALAKAKPGGLSYSSSGVGAGPHLTFALFNNLAGINIVHVPNRLEVLDLLPGRVQASFATISSVHPHLQSGALKPIAVSSAERSALLPNIPTTSEAGVKDADYMLWAGMFVPAKTPREIVTRLHAEISKAVQTPDMKERLAKLGADPMVMTPEQFGAQLKKEIADNIELIKKAGIQAN